MYSKPFHQKELNDSSFLITGGAGFIGSNIVEYLLQHNAGKVIVLDNLATGFEENIAQFKHLPNFNFIKGDICNPQVCNTACEGVDYVFHQAALGSVPRSIENPLATHTTNATGYINMLVAARDAKVKRLVYASSSSIYGDSMELPKVESRIGKQLSPYAVSKYVNELYGEIFSRTYAMEIIGLRYFNIFGPRQNPTGQYAAAIPLFINALLNNTSPYVNGDGEQTRDFTFVANAVQANIKAMFAEHINTEGNIFNVATGERTSLNQLIKILQKLIDCSILVQYKPGRAGDVRDSLADISKAYNHLAYTPLIKIEEGLRYTLEWFVKEEEFHTTTILPRN